MLAVTGVTGFIGGYVVPKLGVPYRALVREAENVRVSTGDILGDLQNAYDTEQLVKGCDTLLHLACSTNPRTSDRDISADLSQNLLPGVTLFEQFYQQNPGGHIIFASTGGAMFDHHQNQGKIAENVAPKPWSSYGVHKLALEQYLATLAEKHGGRATVLRISNPYGVLLPSARGQGLIGVAMTLHRQSKALSVIEHPESVRDYIHMEDVLSAVRTMLKQPAAEGRSRLYHIGSGMGISIREVIEQLGAAVGEKLRYEVTDAAKKMRPTYNVLDTQKAAQELNWRPQIAFQDGLRAMWKAVNNAAQ